eukprot:CAMPEP_0206454466 /NCGR_PEP_ID=MMETSP0324_2-20121206/21152_1 /ASSEMBLY_ACC=CAM_ASM_000836 /TAXON_ID=2866 /ORGANISM="Crypthecodinium cohnii, Strain Seligo" /LENGTH=471 /DNA_ID=CAMNT_0053924941 /DNA_START=67 /DNA_END=1482 /DNA_ORIENTATION=+
MQTSIKNTFIECPETPAGGLPAPLASAPAQYAWTLKDSLSAAAAGGDEVAGGKFARPKPNPLNTLAPAVTTITETPLATPSSSVGPAKYNMTGTLSGSGSMPPTPAGGMGWGATPTGSPVAAAQPQRTTLSLVSMIQSPNVNSKTVMLESAYNKLYQIPASSTAPVVLSSAAPGTMPYATAVSGPRTLSTSMSTAPAPLSYGASKIIPVRTVAPCTASTEDAGSPLSPPPQQPPQIFTYRMAPPAPLASPGAGAAGKLDSIQSEDDFASSSAGAGSPAAAAATSTVEVQKSPLAAVKLGLLSGPAPTGAPTAAYFTATKLSTPAPTVVKASPPRTAPTTTTTVVAAPQYQAPVSRTMMMPPPPSAPAPTFTPKGIMHLPGAPLSAPPSDVPATPAGFKPPTRVVLTLAAKEEDKSEDIKAPEKAKVGLSEDMKVLLDMAVSSGNKAAIDVLRRQAKASGMSEEDFDALVAA